jgi:Fe-S cluster assembly protein SufD
MSMTATKPALIRTKAEQALVEQFDAAAASLPGSPAIGAARRAAMARFAQQGLPHRRIEEWKYTDLRALLREAYPQGRGGIAAGRPGVAALEDLVPGLVLGLDAHILLLVDGAFVGAAGKSAPAGVECQPLAAALRSDGPTWVHEAIDATVSSSDSVIALNTAYMADGVALRIADGVKVDRPVHVVLLSSAAEPRALATRIVVEVGAGAEVTLIESHLTRERQDNAVTQIKIGDGARVAHVKNVEVRAPSVHLGNWLVRVGANALYQPFQLTIGTGVARHGLEISLVGGHSRCDLASTFLVAGRGHVDTTMVVDHVAPHCTSRELIKGVLDGAARGIFQGKVIVRPGAQKTDGKQMARALLLSPDAEFDSKPELEIYADDVVCGHGSTSMELDEDLMFYCRSRGIPESEARLLLVESFMGEAIDKIGHEGLREGLRARARGWLRDGV